MRRLTILAAAVFAAVAVAWSVGSAGADAEPTEGWWSGTIEVASEADRTYKIRYDTEPASNDRVLGTSSHALQYRIEFEPTLGWSDSFMFHVPDEFPDHDTIVAGTNARITYFNWAGAGSAQNADSCAFVSSGSLVGPISSPIAFEGFRHVVEPRWSEGPAPPRGQLSLSPLGSCEVRPIFGIADFFFRVPDSYDEVIFRGIDQDYHDTVRSLSLCADRFDSEGTTRAADLITIADGRPVIDSSGSEDCDGALYYDFGDSIVTQEDVVTVNYDIDASFTPRPSPAVPEPELGPDQTPEPGTEPDPGEEAQHRPAPHLGLVCGRARFDFHALNTETDGDFVDEGETACMVALSNALTLELGEGGLLATEAVIRRFGYLFLGTLGDKAVEAIVKTAKKKVGYSILKGIVPGLGKAAGKVSPIVRAGKALALAIVPYAAATHLKHLRKYKGCTRLLLAVDDGKLRMGGGLLYSPRGLNDPRDDRELTEASVWRQTKRWLPGDDWDRMASGLTCTGKGQIGLSSKGNEIFSRATYSLLHG